MSPEHLSTPSYLYIIRLWPEDLGNGEVEWRGQVQHVLSGEAHYFRRWAELIAHLQAMVEQANTAVFE